MSKPDIRRNRAMYCVVVGDIVNSRNLDAETREKIKRAAKEVFDRVNTEYIGSLMTTFGMVRGDAFEGVLLTQSHAPKIVQDIIKAFYRADRTAVRVSAVMGQLTATGSDRNDADGPAFHKALDDLARMKESKSAHWLQVSFDTGSLAQPLVDSQLGLLTALTEGWTDKQREIVWASEKYGGGQKVVGKALDISPSVVSKQLKAARYDIYRGAWDALTVYLENMDEYTVEEKPAVEKSYVPYFNMACRKFEQDHDDEALSLLQKALALAKEALDAGDPLLIPIYNKLAEVYTFASKYADAEDKIQESMRLQETMPKARFQYADTLITKALLFYKKEIYAEAQKYAEESISIAHSVLDEGHPYWGYIEQIIALIYQAMNQPQNALLYFEKSLRRAKENVSREPYNYAIGLGNIASYYYSVYNYEKALPYAEETLQILEEILPPGNKNITTARSLLSDIQSHLGGEPK